MAECAAAANVAVKPAPSAHRFAATGLTATRGREEAIDAVDAALCLSQPTGKRVGADASSVDVSDRPGADAGGLMPEPFGNTCRAATGGRSGAFFSEGIRLTLIVALQTAAHFEGQICWAKTGQF